VVTSPNGARVGGAFVLFHVDKAGEIPASGRADVSANTASDGSTTSELAPGFYDLFVTGLALSPQCRKLLVEVGKPVRLAIQLNADPLVMRHLGDVF